MFSRQFLRRLFLVKRRLVPFGGSFLIGRRPHSILSINRPSELIGNLLVQHRWYSPQSNGSTVFELASEDDFDDRVLQAHKPVMVQFYADWCGPCQNLAPRIEAKVNGEDGEVLLARINVDSSVGSLAGQFDVTSVPTVLCFLNGDIVHRFEGDVDDSYLDDIIAQLKEADSKNG